MKKPFKYFSFFIVFFFLTIQAFAADVYYVIHLKGFVNNVTTGKPLKVGDKISVSDQIKFGSKDAVAVIMGANGKYTLSPTVSGNTDSELVAYVKSALLPLKSNGHLSTRGGESENVMDLKSYFGTSKFFIIGNKLSIKLDATKYPLSDKKMFIYRYVNNGVVVSKKIENQGNVIVIDKDALYTANGAYIEPTTVDNVDIYYYDTESKTSTKIVNFIPNFINEETLKEEIKVQKNILKQQKASSEKINKELSTFIFDVYGKTDEATFHKWVKTNVNAE